MHGTEVWQGRKVKINHSTGKKKKGLQYFIVIICPKSHYRTGSHCYLKNSLKMERRKLPHPIMLIFFMTHLERSQIDY